MDRTLHLYNGYERTAYVDGRIRGIHCCSDLSVACNRSDLDRREGRASAPGATAKGSVPDTGALAGAWLTGFGRSVASAQVDRLGERLAAGNGRPHLTLGGYRIGLTPGSEAGDPGEDAYTGARHRQAPTGRDFTGLVDDGPGRPVTGAMTGATTGGDFLTGSSFLFTGGEAASGRWSGWGSAAPLAFTAAPGAPGDGRLELVGADRERGRLLAGYGVVARVCRGQPGAARFLRNRDFDSRGASLSAAGTGRPVLALEHIRFLDRRNDAASGRWPCGRVAAMADRGGHVDGGRRCERRGADGGRGGRLRAYGEGGCLRDAHRFRRGRPRAR